MWHARKSNLNFGTEVRLRTPPGMWAKLESRCAVIWHPDGRLRVTWAFKGSLKPLRKVLWSWTSQPCWTEPVPGWLQPQPARGDEELREQSSVGGWQFVCVVARQRNPSSPVRGVILRTLMDDNGRPQRTAGEETSSPDSHRSDARFQRRVAALNYPALPAARLTLPGVMDAEGRVDESRLRMHIFKHGRKWND